MTTTNWTEEELRHAAQLAVDHVRTLGTGEATASARASGGIRVTVREGAVDTALREAGQSLTITALRDGRRGVATTAAFDAASIRRTADEAFAIAGIVQPDPDASLADPALLAHDGPQPPLFSPSGRSPADLIDSALALDAAASAVTVADGVTIRVAEAGAATTDMRFAVATSDGFCRSDSASHHGRWLMVKAQDAGGAEVAVTESVDRRFDALDLPAVIAAQSVARATALLGARTLSSRRAPVLLDARIAPVLIWDLVAALSGDAQHRGATAFPDALGRAIAAPHVDLIEDPFEPFGLASGGFDGEGVAGTMRPIVAAGVAKGYFLGTLSARRLGLRSTGNAGGPWNLRLTSRSEGGVAQALRRRMGTGLIVTAIKGGATDPVSGTWTRAVAGLWVEGGVIVHPVTDVTVGGTLAGMLDGIVAIGDDVHRSGAVRTGSILIDALQIAGAA